MNFKMTEKLSQNLLVFGFGVKAKLFSLLWLFLLFDWQRIEWGYKRLYMGLDRSHWFAPTLRLILVVVVVFDWCAFSNAVDV